MTEPLLLKIMSGDADDDLLLLINSLEHKYQHTAHGLSSADYAALHAAWARLDEITTPPKIAPQKIAPPEQ